MRPEPVLVFERSTETRRLLCCFNLGAKAVEVSLTLDGSPTALEGCGLDGKVDGSTLLLPAYGGVFAALD